MYNNIVKGYLTHWIYAGSQPNVAVKIIEMHRKTYLKE